MALTMLDKTAERSEKKDWPVDIAAELEREKKHPLQSANKPMALPDKVRQQVAA